MSMPRWFALLTAAALAGCTVGPRVETPEPPLPAAFVNAQSDVNAIAAGDLWRSLDDAALNTLIDAALASNTSIEQAVAMPADARRTLGDGARSIWVERYQPQRMHASYARLYRDTLASPRVPVLDACAS